ncbi:MAG TPA: PAS domain S-box protein [Thiobacillaceae bacterium]|nr:PAS domain S-box protein [Thiobacillaceae bacterium]
MTDYASLTREQLIERLFALESRMAVTPEQALSEDEQHEVAGYLRQLVASVDEAFWICDLDQERFLYLSPTVENLFGLPLADLYDEPPCFLSVVHPEDRERVATACMRQHTDGKILDLECRILPGPDDLRWIRLRRFPIRDATGRIHRMAGVAWDITERRAAEQEYRTIIQASMDSFWKVGADGRILDYNAAACAMLGYSHEELARLSIHDIDLHEDAAKVAAHIRLVIAQGQDRFETRHRRKDGHVIDVEVSAYHLPRVGGGRLVAFLRDITDRKRTEEALRASEERYRAVVEDQTEVICRFDSDGVLVFVNEVFCRFFGCIAQEVLGTTWHPSAYPDDMELVESRLATLSPAHPVVVIENRVYSGDGQLRWMQFVNRAFFDDAGRITEIQAVGRDITERIQAEQAWREAEAFKQAILDAVSTQVAVLDRTGTIIEVNAAWRRFARENALEDGQFPHNTDIGGNYLEICRSATGYSSEGAREMAEGIQAVLDGRLPGFIHEYPCHAPHARRWFLATVTPLGRAEGGVVISHHDISAPRLLAEELRQSEALTRSILRAAPVGIGLLVDRVFREVNQAMTDMTGYTREELIGRSARMLYPTQEDFDYVGREKYGQIKEKGLGQVETRFRTKNGRIIDVALSSAPVVPGDLTHGVSFTAQDITAVKRAERERLQHEAKQRDALVREVHHRIKNNLQGVIGLMRQHISAHPETRAPIEAAIEQINTIAVVHGLQSRLGQHELRLCEMLHAVNAATSMAMALAPSTIDDRRGSDIWLDSGAAVSVALILNELLHNALKHGHHAGGVNILLTGGGEHATISISNPGGPLPPGFDLENGTGCGTGLDLVRTLLPRRGATLTMTQGEGRITANLVLAPPVTAARPRDATTCQEEK